jgi:hypothetical protein
MVDIVFQIDPRTGRERPIDREFQQRVKVVRVIPKNEAIRKGLRHWPSRVGFPKEGSAEWPFDTFTKRRIKDGDVTIEKPEDREAGESKNRRIAPPTS